MSDPTKQKGEIVGSITLHVNSKLRISHVEIQGRGDLVQKRTIQDSLILVFHAMLKKRAGRKAHGKAEQLLAVQKADLRDSDRLLAHREKKKKEQDAAEAEMLAAVNKRKEAKELAVIKAEILIRPGSVPVKISKEERKKTASAEALKIAIAQSKNNMNKTAPKLPVATIVTPLPYVKPVAVATKQEDK